MLTFLIEVRIISIVDSAKEQRRQPDGPSPNGKATDSDSVISRFESWWASYLLKVPRKWYFFCSIRKTSLRLCDKKCNYDFFYRAKASLRAKVCEAHFVLIMETRKMTVNQKDEEK